MTAIPPLAVVDLQEREAVDFASRPVAARPKRRAPGRSKVTVEKVGDNNQKTSHMEPQTADSAILCGDNNTQTLDLTRATASNPVNDSGQFNGWVYTMKRHRLLDIFCNDKGEIRVSVGGAFKYVSKHKFL